ncbi:MAG: prepilin-type N-terminal cleavage/methylation domain-containing protein [Candidatus Riflebacteria bacterium]|nr:prepilin-type N-terminal cleavage/methylation domain-containing protein [Candidatus Riflebacteria bacterium]
MRFHLKTSAQLTADTMIDQTQKSAFSFRHHKIRGITLLEIMISLAVFAVICVVFFRLLGGGRQKLELSSNFFSSIYISSKVVADALEEGRINSSFLEFLSDHPEMTNENSVVNADSPFFRQFEDRGPPFGSFQPDTDYGIIKQDGTLFEQFENFRVKLSAQRLEHSSSAGYEKHLANTKIETFWTEKDGHKRSFIVNMCIPSPSGPLPPEGISIDDALILSRAREYIFPLLSGKTLDQAISETGCDRETAICIAKIGIILDDLQAALASETDELHRKAQLRQPLLKSFSNELLEIQIKIARETETTSSLIYNVLLEIAPLVKKITMGSPTKVANIPSGSLDRAFNTFITTSEQIVPWANSTIDAYKWLLNPGFDTFESIRRKDFIRIKYHEGMRLLTALDVMTKNQMLNFLSEQKKSVEGKNLFLERSFTWEENAWRDDDSLKRVFPNLFFIREQIKNSIFYSSQEASKFLKTIPTSSTP